jgi:hypothetical protein
VLATLTLFVRGTQKAMIQRLTTSKQSLHDGYGVLSGFGTFYLIKNIHTTQHKMLAASSQIVSNFYIKQTIRGLYIVFFELFKNVMLGGDQNMWMIEKVASILFF